MTEEEYFKLNERSQGERSLVVKYNDLKRNINSVEAALEELDRVEGVEIVLKIKRPAWERFYSSFVKQSYTKSFTLEDESPDIIVDMIKAEFLERIEKLKTELEEL